MSPAKEAPADGATTAWITRITTWLAPTTLITALLFFIGYVYTSAYYGYFGIDSSTLAFDSRDVLVRGESPLVLPAGVVAFVALVLALLFHVASRFIRQGRDGAQVVRRACWAVTVAALVLLVSGFLAGFEMIRPGGLGTPLMIGGGLLLIVLARILIRRSSGVRHALSGERAAMGIAVAIIALCAFWAATTYASSRGSDHAKAVGRNLYLRPAVILDTVERLHLDLSACADPNSTACLKSEWDGLTETKLPDAGPQDRFRYRYRGLRLLAQSGDRMFLLPRHWTWEHGDLLILPMDADVRVALSPG